MTATASPSKSESSTPPWVRQSSSLHRHRQAQESSTTTAAAATTTIAPIFADTTASYNAFAQAWRMLGIYVDCTGLVGVENNGNEHEGGGGNNNNNNRNKNGQQNSCQRYLLWAAYIDGNYQGNSYGEYQYYDVTNQQWDDTACDVTQSSRCAKLDCHVPYSTSEKDDNSDDTTSWQLLGIYKERYYASEWFEQLFKHAGYCLWNNYTTYSFMHTYYNVWPENNNGCVQSKSNDPHTGQPLYIDLAPGPVLRLALYTDAICYTEHSTLTSAEYDAIITANGYLSSASQYAFNQHLSQFSACQPCRAVNWHNNGQKSNGNSNDDYNYNNQKDEGNNDYSNDANYPLFACYDDAGYTNVNQCMKFRTHTTLLPCTFADVQTALLQGAILHVTLGNSGPIYSPLLTKTLHNDESAPSMLGLLLQTSSTSSSSSSSSSTSMSTENGSAAMSTWWVLSLAGLAVVSAFFGLAAVLVWKWNRMAPSNSPKNILRRRRQQKQQRESSFSARFARRAMLSEPLVDQAAAALSPTKQSSPLSLKKTPSKDKNQTLLGRLESAASF